MSRTDKTRLQAHTRETALDLQPLMSARAVLGKNRAHRRDNVDTAADKYVFDA